MNSVPVLYPAGYRKIGNISPNVANFLVFSQYFVILYEISRDFRTHPKMYNKTNLNLDGYEILRWVIRYFVNILMLSQYFVILYEISQDFVTNLKCTKRIGLEWIRNFTLAIVRNIVLNFTRLAYPPYNVPIDSGLVYTKFEVRNFSYFV
jgi:hypothetical protein